MPSFDLLPDLSPDKPQQGAGGSRSGTDEPFIYLLQLSQRAASAGKLAGAAPAAALCWQHVASLFSFHSWGLG